MTIPTLARQRWIPAVNISGESIPPFAAVCLRGYEVNGNRWFLKIDKMPFDLIQFSDAVGYQLDDNTTYLDGWPWAQRVYLAFNGPGAIAAGSRGTVTQQLPAMVRIDSTFYEHGQFLRPDRQWRLTAATETDVDSYALWRTGLRLIANHYPIGLVGGMQLRSEVEAENQ